MAALEELHGSTAQVGEFASRFALYSKKHGFYGKIESAIYLENIIPRVQHGGGNIKCGDVE